MLRKPVHGWTINPEIQKLTAFRTPSPGSATRTTPLTSLSTLPPKSRFRYTQQCLSASSLETRPSAVACYSRAPEPHPNAHLEDPFLDEESLRESSDDWRENGGDGEGFCRRRPLPEERELLYTCVSEYGECSVYVVGTKHNSRELCREKSEKIFCLEREVRSLIICPCDLVMPESLKQNPEVVNKLEVYPGERYDVAKEELKKYGGTVIPLKEQVANMLEVYLGRRFRVAYERAMKYGFGVMVHHFPLQVALCSKKPLSTKITLIKGSLMFETTDLLVGPWKRRAVPSRCSRLWRVCLLHLLEWIQSQTGEMK